MTPYTFHAVFPRDPLPETWPQDVRGGRCAIHPASRVRSRVVRGQVADHHYIYCQACNEVRLAGRRELLDIPA